MPGENINEPGLTLPHPGVSMRNFVLYPLADIAPTLVIPGHGIVSELLRAVGDEGISVLELHENCQW
jgi:2-amino-4-hydroxy-6-hydroxymethyldihydropteridine diphosphokinase